MVDFQDARRAMVEGQLRTTGVIERRVLSAFRQVPREHFVPEARRGLSYVDEALPLTATRALPAPAIWGRLVQLAEIRPGDKVLEIACGTGYGLAVLARLADRVVGVESETALAEAAQEAVAALGLANVEVVQGALSEGAPLLAPFDVILVSGSVERLSKALFTQLADGGRLVAVEGRGAAGVAHLYLRSGDDVVSRAEFNASLPALDAFARPAEFAF